MVWLGDVMQFLYNQLSCKNLAVTIMCRLGLTNGGSGDVFEIFRADAIWHETGGFNAIPRYITKGVCLAYFVPLADGMVPAHSWLDHGIIQVHCSLRLSSSPPEYLGPAWAVFSDLPCSVR